jgi:hypothetical protein
MQFSFLPTDGPQLRSALELMERRYYECLVALQRLDMRVSYIERERAHFTDLLSQFASITEGWTGPLTPDIELDFEVLELLRLAVHIYAKEAMQSSPDQIALEREHGNLMDRLTRAVAMEDEEDEEDSVPMFLRRVREDRPGFS